MNTNLLVRNALAEAGIEVSNDGEGKAIVGSRREVGLQSFTIARKPSGYSVHVNLDLPESRLPESGIHMFHELAVEGSPIVAYGAGNGRVTFGFEWYHPDGADWRISATRVALLMDRLQKDLVAVGDSPRTASRRPVLSSGIPSVLSAALRPAQ